MADADIKLNAVAPWFGGKRTLAPLIVQQLGEHSYFFDGCFGGLTIIFAKEPSEHECVCDVHGAITNLAWIVQGEKSAALLFNLLQRQLYSDELYAASKDWLDDFEKRSPPVEPHLDWAYHYFIASWMGRNGLAGTARVNYQIATRWTAGGGSGPLRFRNAVDSIPGWCERLRNVQILRRDLLQLLPKIDDAEGVAIYVDPPYLPGTVSGNSRYQHDFTAAQHKQLAELLRRFKRARVVVSYYAAPELVKLYSGWTQLDCSRHKHLHCQNGRGSSRSEAPEVLLINGPVFEGPAETADLFTGAD